MRGKLGVRARPWTVINKELTNLLTIKVGENRAGTCCAQVQLIMEILLWIACGAVGYAIGKGKNRGAFGFVMGLLLGPIGWIIVACCQDSSIRCGACKESIRPGATICPHCRTPISVQPSATPA